ncbi:MAG: efflux RND transporter periplasmic adaptor subunit [Gammaproteobacteria bacterium]|nr:efflux RND transporter periplasmic adaptor subunit [Gammaproteobacteria bacterium]
MKCSLCAISSLILALGVVRLVAAEAPTPKITMNAAQLQSGGVVFSAAKPVDAGAAPAGAGLSLRLSGRAVVPNAALDQVLAPVEGRIEALLVDPGQNVRAGQPLVRIRSAQVLELQRELVSARARAQLAGARAQRDQQLNAEGIISRNRLLESQAAATEAEADLRAQGQMLRLAGFSESALERIRDAGDIVPVVTLSAARPGRVLQQSVTAGQSVVAGDPLLRVASLDRLWIEMQATRDQAQGIRSGDAVAVPGCPAPGQVIATSVLLDAQSQTVTVRAEIPRAAECLAPNQFVEAQVSPRAAPGLVAVPESSVVQHAGASYVFQRISAGLQPVLVKVERRANGSAWVRGTLAPGAQVASGGLAAIKGSWLGLGAAAQAP